MNFRTATLVALSTLCIPSLSLTPLEEPRVVDILPDTQYDFAIDYCDFSAPPFITSMTAFCYCFYDTTLRVSFNCSIPGPTFLFHPGSRVSLTFHNRMYGIPSTGLTPNQFKDLDLTNIHTHGFHISPDEDDTTLIILPGQDITYSFNIPSDHYTGSHFIHAHHQGSTAFQVGQGLFMGALMTYLDGTDTTDDILNGIEDNILIFHSIYHVSTSLCNCSANAQWETYFYWPSKYWTATECISGQECYIVYSQCYMYCSMPASQRVFSGFEYKMESDFADEFQLYLVNGQFSPTVSDMIVGVYRRFRMINAMNQYYIQYAFPVEFCVWYIVAIDGVWLANDELRSLNEAPYVGQYILPPGGRLDVIVACSVPGNFSVMSSESNARDATLINMVRVPENVTLFAMMVSESLLVGNTGVVTPVVSYPERPEYLADLSAVTELGVCACNTYFLGNETSGDVTWTENECGIVMNMRNLDSDATPFHNINGFQYDPTVPSTSLNFGEVFEFNFIPHFHPYHQHISPFQLQTNIGIDGFQGLAYDHHDTIGGPKIGTFFFRTYTSSYTGSQLAQSDALAQQDLGMATNYDILDPRLICDPNTGTIIPAPTTSPPSTGYPSTSPTPSPVYDPNECPFIEANVADFIVLFDASCALLAEDCNVLLQGVGDIVIRLLNTTTKLTRVQTMQYKDGELPDVLVSFEDELFQENPDFYAQVIEALGECESGGKGDTDLNTALQDVLLYFTKPNTFYELIIINTCIDDEPDICNKAAPELLALGVDSYIVNFLNGSSVTANIITDVEADTYLSCIVEDNSGKICRGLNQFGVGKAEFQAINDECLFPLICYPQPTPLPTFLPTSNPTYDPSKAPTSSPAVTPVKPPTGRFTFDPTKAPSKALTKKPTAYPTKKPTAFPSKSPTKKPSVAPTRKPTAYPTKKPTDYPTKKPTAYPTKKPTMKPTAYPTKKPAMKPTMKPTPYPVDAVTYAPSNILDEKCMIGEKCVDTEDCCVGDIVDERELGITCSCYTKYNYIGDWWDKDTNYCCIKKDNYGCKKDEDCCKIKSYCLDGLCIQK